MTEVARDLPALPVRDGVRHLALVYLEDARRAVGRLPQDDDPEALHDFRVALRRLRGLLRAYPSPTGPRIPKKLRRRVRRLAADTSAGRDLEVQIAWIAAEESALSPKERTGAQWFLARLAQEREAQSAAVGKHLPGDFSTVGRRLGKRLDDVRNPKGPTPTFATETARLVTDAAVELVDRLQQVRAATDAKEAHRARIQGKRLRYLLEPIADAAAGAPELLDRLRSLQELLGELDECHLLAREIGAAVEELAGTRARRAHEAVVDGAPRPRTARSPEDAGLLALARRVRARRDRVFVALESVWLGDQASALLPAVRQGVATLQRVAPQAARAAAPYRATRKRVGYRARAVTP